MTQTREIQLPFNQKAIISVSGEFDAIQNLYIGKVQSFAKEAIRVLADIDHYWAAKLSGMTNQEFAIDRCKLAQRDCGKLVKYGCNVEFVKVK